MTRLPVPGDPVLSGPFHSEQQARSAPAVREAYDAVADGRRGELARHGHRMICRALTDAGVDPGEYDHQIIVWLAGLNEPKACAVIAGLIARASKAARP